ncbi:MAG: flavin reductase family protein [Nonlabens sp.]|uniref:flavin reductase family protein n=1 Tax=Nonlabens sp. TaxID=1888209 RepID=UPI003EF237F1
MKHIAQKDIENLDRFYRGNLINSVTGYKSANLLATRSQDGIDNVAIFSSVTHLGSNPAMFSFVQRPLGHGVGHTYENLKATGKITLNHINMELVERAHQSSAKYPREISEFERLDIGLLNRNGFHAPFVKEANIQVAAEYVSDYLIKENNCILVICKITDIFIIENIQHKDGWLDLEKAGSATINGLDGYAVAKTQKRLSYAQINKELEELTLDTDA